MVTQSENRTALITGASQGLGLALARELAQRGFALIITGRNTARLEAARAELAQSTAVTAIAGDVVDEAHRQQLAKVVQTLGGLDVLVNNAGILGASPLPRLLDIPLDTLHTIYQTNVFAPLALIQALAPTLSDDARIINISSDAGVEAYPTWGGYGSSKAALEQLSAILAAENPQWRVYWVDPGDMQTQMYQDAFPGEDISDRPPAEAAVPGLLRLITGNLPSGRYQAQAMEPEAAHIQELRLVITAQDFDAMRGFFIEGLGLPQIADWSDADARGIMLAAGRATIEIFDEAQAAKIDQIEVGKRTAGQFRLGFAVPDVDTTAANLADYTALSERIVAPWGHTSQRFAAPEDIQVTLFAGDEELSD